MIRNWGIRLHLPVSFAMAMCIAKTSFREKRKKKNLFMYLHISKDPRCLKSHSDPDKNQNQQPNAVIHGSEGRVETKRQPNTSRPREMPPDRIQRDLLYGVLEHSGLNKAK